MQQRLLFLFSLSLGIIAHPLLFAQKQYNAPTPDTFLLGFERGMNGVNNGRIDMEFGYSYLHVSFLSVAWQKDTQSNTFSVSPYGLLSGLVGMPLVLVGSGMPHGKPYYPFLIPGILLVLPQALGNFSLRYPLEKEYVYVIGGQRTDYFSSPSDGHIYTESFLGIQGRPIKELLVTASCSLPELKAFLPDNKPFFSMGVHWTPVN